MLYVSRKFSLLLVYLLGALLFSSLFVCAFVNSSSGASLENTIHVKNEDELKNAVDNVDRGRSVTIALDDDITLSVLSQNYFLFFGYLTIHYFTSQTV